MIILIEYDKAIRSFNNLNTSFNTELLEINEVFSNNSVSTILIYQKNLTKDIKNSFQNKRKVQNLSSLDFSKVLQDCLIFFHSDIIDEKTDIESVNNLFKFCRTNHKHLVLQFSNHNQHLFNQQSVDFLIKRQDLSTYLTLINRELKLNNFL